MATRQQLLVLYLGNSDLHAAVASWAFYDGSSQEPLALEEVPDSPPYANGLDALRDGWRLVSWPRLQPHDNNSPYELSYLPHEFIFEKIVNTLDGATEC